MENHLIAICSGTKGIGKTWLAVTLSNALSLLKKKVLFFDADCSVTNITYQLDLKNTKNYKSLINGNAILNNNIVFNEKAGFDIISSHPGDSVLSSGPVGRIQVLARDLFCFSKYYDHIVVDCSDDDVKNVNNFINICKTIIIIVNTDPTSLINAYKKIEKIKKINSTAKIHIVINRAFSYNEGNNIYENLLKASSDYIKVDLNLLGIIRQDSRIRECVLNKSLLLHRYPASEGAEDVFSISKKILEITNNDI